MTGDDGRFALNGLPTGTRTGVGGIPLQYGGPQANGCGAVLLWTKR